MLKIIKKLSIISFLTLIMSFSTDLVFTDKNFGQSNAQTTVGSNIEGEDYQNNNPFARTLCNVLNIATGNGGKAFAAFAIISLGIGFFTGKVSWGLMLGVAAGIAAMFGAPAIVAAISGGTSFDCSVITATAS